MFGLTPQTVSFHRGNKDFVGKRIFIENMFSWLFYHQPAATSVIVLQQETGLSTTTRPPGFSTTIKTKLRSLHIGIPNIWHDPFQKTRHRHKQSHIQLANIKCERHFLCNFFCSSYELFGSRRNHIHLCDVCAARCVLIKLLVVI